MKYLFSVLAVVLLAGAGCAAPVETEVHTDLPSEIEAETTGEEAAEEAEDSAEALPADDTQATADEATTDEEVTLELEGGELTFVPAEEEIEEVSDPTEDDVQVVDIVLGTSADVNVDMQSGNFFFAPDTLTVEPGASVKITFTENAGFHTFVIDELDINFSISEGEALKFTAPTEPGTYAYYCDIGSHRAFGMEGTLIVE